VVEQESGSPLAGLLVRAHDRDVLYDDDLGEVETDAEGRFEIVYTEAQFQDVIETRPDLYLRIYDAAGRLVHTTERAVRRDAHIDERYEIAIPRARLSQAGAADPSARARTPIPKDRV
jgi:carotenoid cleavage dioxygenase